MTGSTHEKYYRRESLQTSSDRAFGLVFAGLFLLIGLAPLRRGHPPHAYMMLASVAVLGTAFAFPAILAPFNYVWTRLALLVGKVTPTIAFGVIFFGVLSPLGSVLRHLGWDPLRLKSNASSDTLWIPVKTDLRAESMKHLY
jgi:hypothetical protein